VPRKTSRVPLWARVPYVYFALPGLGPRNTYHRFRKHKLESDSADEEPNRPAARRKLSFHFVVSGVTVDTRGTPNIQRLMKQPTPGQSRVSNSQSTGTAVPTSYEYTILHCTESFQVLLLCHSRRSCPDIISSVVTQYATAAVVWGWRLASRLPTITCYTLTAHTTAIQQLFYSFESSGIMLAVSKYSKPSTYTDSSYADS
jgi:hypothetical protein